MNAIHIIIAGVGGQGTLLASGIIGKTAMKNGMDAKASEVHGMAQRGGSAITFVCCNGEKAHAPNIAPGGGDIVLGFELLEAYRSMQYLKKDGRMIVNTQTIFPIPVLTGQMEYPGDIIERINKHGIAVDAFDALALAKQAGNALSVNIVLIGRLAATLNIPKESWVETITEMVKPATLEINLKAFELGYNWSN
jgi:indolepyruvate ferredoxin oxidoreductase beta subunit